MLLGLTEDDRRRPIVSIYTFTQTVHVLDATFLAFHFTLP